MALKISVISFHTLQKKNFHEPHSADIFTDRTWETDFLNCLIKIHVQPDYNYFCNSLPGPNWSPGQEVFALTSGKKLLTLSYFFQINFMQKSQSPGFCCRPNHSEARRQVVPGCILVEGNASTACCNILLSLLAEHSISVTIPCFS